MMEAIAITHDHQQKTGNRQSFLWESTTAISFAWKKNKWRPEFPMPQFQSGRATVWAHYARGEAV